jgi:hypothetical protein
MSEMTSVIAESLGQHFAVYCPASESAFVCFEVALAVSWLSSCAIGTNFDGVYRVPVCNDSRGKSPGIPLVLFNFSGW